MKKIKYLIYIILFYFSLIHFSYANDLSDFEIEGFSLNQSLLDHFTKEQIEKEKATEFVQIYKDSKYMDVVVGTNDQYPLKKNLENFDEVSITIVPNDKSYKMYSISGTLYCKSESECKAKSDEMLSFVETMFKGKYELNTWQENHGSDKSGKSIVFGEEILFNSTKNTIDINYYKFDEKFAKENNYSIHSLQLSINNYKFNKFLREENYN